MNRECHLGLSWKNQDWKLVVRLAIVSLCLGGCPMALLLVPPLIEFGANLMRTADKNYDSAYTNEIRGLLVALQQQRSAAYAPYNQQAGPQGNPQNLNQGYPPSEYSNSSSQTSAPSANHPYDSNAGYQQERFSDPSYPPNQEQIPQNPPDPFASNSAYPGNTPNNPYNQFENPNDPYKPNVDYDAGRSDPYSGQPGGSPSYDQQTGYGTNQIDLVPIGLDVLLVKKVMRNRVETVVPINDGDVLRDGRGNPQAGDKFRIMFRANTDCYVYVIAIDGSAWAQGVFPPPGNPLANPIKKNQPYTIPEGLNWFSLDQFRGIETIFFVASPHRREDIENIMTRIAGRERHPRDTPLQVKEAPIVPHGYSRAQPSPVPFAVQTRMGNGQAIIPTTFFAKTAGDALRITRWFRHQ